MKIRETMQAEWDKAVALNTDPYGACVVQFAEAWADAMEAKMAEGAALADVAKATGSEVDNRPEFGITGFMYGCAVSMLSRCWAHGEELRRWHNLDTQIGTEGEKANASGGVLNPALLSARPVSP